MRLPEPFRILPGKLTGYLLALDHPDGRAKARFFLGHGFDRAAPERLADALRTHARENPVAAVVPSPFGERLVVDGPMRTPDGRQPRVRVVWFRASPTDLVRLVTAYPLDR